MQCNLYHPIDLRVSGACRLENPFQAELRGEFIGPEGAALSIPGFYAGEGVWIVRFSPNMPGTWTYQIFSGDIEIEGSGTGALEAGVNPNPKVHGAVRIHPEQPYHFQHEDGTSHFMMAYEVNWLWALGLGDPEARRVREFVSQIAGYGFNQVLMNVFAYDTSWFQGNTSDKDYGPPLAICWEGTYENTRYERFNTEYFLNLDKVMDILLEHGVNAHLYFKVYNKYVKWPVKYSEGDDLYFRYITARYQAYPNIIWDFSKESYNEPDKAYIRSRLDLIRSLDAYRRLLTVHDDKLLYAEASNCDRLDFVTVQQHFDFHSQVMLQRSRKTWPVLNAEFSYECGAGGLDDHTFFICQTPEEVVKRAYYIVMAGGYPAYYYTKTAWDVVDYSHIPKGYKYFKILYDFFTSLEWWKLEPHNELSCFSHTCLAIPGKEYVCLTTPPDETILLKPGFRFQKLEVSWLNTHTGEVVRAEKPFGEGWQSEDYLRYPCPFPGVPGILHVKVIE